MVNEAIMSYKIMRDSQAINFNGHFWWFSLETKAQNQVFNLYNKVQIGKKYIAAAAKAVLDENQAQVQNKWMDKKIHELFKEKLTTLSKELVNEKQQPEKWIPKLKQEIKKEFSK